MREPQPGNSVTLQVAGVLFDNDGVLVDSHAEGETAWRQLAAEFGLDTDRVLAEMPGVRAVDTLSRHLPPHMVPSAERRLEDLEVAGAEGTAAIVGGPSLVASLPPGRWTVVTSASKRLAEARWRAAGIPFPECPVVAEDVTEGKPSPEPFLVGAARIDAAPERCVVFEDSPSGGRAAVAAGALVIAVGGQPWPQDLQPVARIDDLAAVSAATVDDDRIELTIHPNWSDRIVAAE